MSSRNRVWNREEVYPSYFVNRLQDRFGPLSKLRLRRVDATTVEVVGGAGDDAAVLSIEGRWRMIEAPVQRTVPTTAGTYAIFAVATENDVVNVPETNTDLTDYAFDLRVVADGDTPTIVPGTVDIVRRIGTAVVASSAISSLVQTVGGDIGGPQLRLDAFAGTGDVQPTRQPDGAIGFSISQTPVIVSAGALGAAESFPLDAARETWLTGDLDANLVLTVTGPAGGALAPGMRGALFFDRDTVSRAVTINGEAFTIAGTDTTAGRWQAELNVDQDSNLMVDVHSVDAVFPELRVETFHPWTYPEDQGLPLAGKIIGHFTVRVAAGRSIAIASVDHDVLSTTGTASVVKLQKRSVGGGWADVTGFTGMTLGTALTEVNPADVALADRDQIALVCVTQGGGKGMSVTATLERSR